MTWGRGDVAMVSVIPRPGHRRLAGHRLFRHWSDINWRSFLLVMTGYYAGGIVGILSGFPPSGIAAIWPSTAILLAGLLLAPPRYWWLYLLGAVPTHLLVVLIPTWQSITTTGTSGTWKLAMP